MPIPPPDPRPAPAAPRSLRQRTRGLLRSPYADRALFYGPMLSMVMFLAAAALLVRYTEHSELQRERDSLRRDSVWAGQRLSLEMALMQEQLQSMAGALESPRRGAQRFDRLAAAFVHHHPGALEVYATDDVGVVTRVSASTELPRAQRLHPGSGLADADRARAWDVARATLRTAYSRPFMLPGAGWVVEAATPVQVDQRWEGCVDALFSVDGLMRSAIVQELGSRYAIAVLDAGGRALASTREISDEEDRGGTPLRERVPLQPFDPGLALQVSSDNTAPGWGIRGLYWAVLMLSGLMLLMLWASWRQMRERLRTQQSLKRETAFRRAMENSLSTGMRAIDMSGRITYVNAALCRMTGFSEQELVGSAPPHPYWPAGRKAEMALALQQTIDGLAPPSGFALRLMRKDGSEFDARVYVSPLIDARERQTGWMASITDITEPTRIRHELAASHERFVAVLEGLDAAVSVLALDGNEQLYANKLYRQWFGSSSHGHHLLSGREPPDFTAQEGAEDIDAYAGLPAGALLGEQSQVHEVRVEVLDRWFDVRQRYIQWVDGRVVQMLIATDVTARRHAEDVARGQEDRAQMTSRLISMGEMASSLAHELNQPLTAIANYCSGMIARLKNQSMPPQELEAALEKTARQAQRAAGVIRRVRDFVRKSEPHRVPCRIPDIVQNTLELAEIELRRRNVRLFTHIAPALPPVAADPILIEQVLLNLLRNAAESVDKAQRSGLLRSIDLDIAAGPGHAVVAVRDNGTGISDEVMAHLFEAFYTTKAEGLGIGLNICRSIIEFHRGRLWAENQYNQGVLSGSLFSFTLPFDADAATAATAAGRDTRGSEPADDGPRGQAAAAAPPPARPQSRE